MEANLVTGGQSVDSHRLVYVGDVNLAWWSTEPRSARVRNFAPRASATRLSVVVHVGRS